jgi:hypothetical protein
MRAEIETFSTNLMDARGRTASKEQNKYEYVLAGTYNTYFPLTKCLHFNSGTIET